MRKRLAAWAFYWAWGQSLGEFTEDLKRTWLDKGHARGKEAPRTGLPFALILTRGDETSQPASVIGAQGSGYRWWGCVDPANGHEVMLGTLEEVGLREAHAAYCSTLGPEVLAWLEGKSLAARMVPSRWLEGSASAPVLPPSDICPNCRSKVLPEDAALTGKCKSCGWKLGTVEGRGVLDHLGQPTDSVGE